MNLFGLVLSGGQSQRMGEDKGALKYHGRELDQRHFSYQILSQFCDQVFVSLGHHSQTHSTPDLPVILDQTPGSGPGVGILSAHERFPERAWLVLACDFPNASESEIKHLIQHRSPSFAATSLIHSDQTVEPFFTVWELRALRTLKLDFAGGDFSPRKTLEKLAVQKVKPLASPSLYNINSPADRNALLR